MKFKTDIFDLVKYIKKENVNDDALAASLREIVLANSPKIYFDLHSLKKAISQYKNITEMEYQKICLMTTVSGFGQLVGTNSNVQQNDLERYVRNAIQETGFNRTEVLRLTSDIAFSLGIATRCSTLQDKITLHKVCDAVNENRAYVIANSVYEEELEEIRSVIMSGKEIEKNYFRKLEPLVAAGLPKAKFYMGYCLLKGINLEEDSEKGLALLQEAADAGDIEAAAILGDYYFKKADGDSWTKAYEYYTGFGAMALNKKRRQSITDIFNQKKYNKQIVILCVILFLLFVISLIFMPMVTLYALHPIWTGICVILEILLLILTFLMYFYFPYDFLYAIPVFMFGVWSFGFLIKLLF